MKHTILYIDDEPENLHVFKVTFRHDYNVITADSAKQGIYYLQQTPIDLVVADFKMPEKNGIDFLSEIEKAFPFVGRIVLTAHSTSEVVMQAINNAHVFGFATKPWSKD